MNTLPTETQAAWKTELATHIRGDVFWNHTLSPYTTIRTGGPAECLVHPKNPEDVTRLYSIARAHGVPVTILGKGSNILVADSGIPGIVIRLVSPYFTAMEILPDHRLHVGAGVLKSDALGFALEHNLRGLEFSSGIPGDMGGALMMNAGTKYGCYGDCLVSVDILRPQTGTVERVSDAATRSHYREQTYIRDGLVLECVLQLQPGDGAEGRAEMNRIIAERAAKQPLDWPNFGSTFKNPEHVLSAGRMIEQANLKGTRIGGAEVSEKHANFTLNKGGASSRDVAQLMCLVQERVHESFSIWLEPEVRLLGNHPIRPRLGDHFTAERDDSPR
jgi:UDP-N-acetylmuramate dehydrogenase